MPSDVLRRAIAIAQRGFGVSESLFFSCIRILLLMVELFLASFPFYHLPLSGTWLLVAAAWMRPSPMLTCSILLFRMPLMRPQSKCKTLHNDNLADHLMQ